MSPENKAHYESENEAIHLLLTGIRDEIYSTVDACKTSHEMWIAIERLQQGESINIQDVKTNLFWEKQLDNGYDASQCSVSSTTSTRMVKVCDDVLVQTTVLQPHSSRVRFITTCSCSSYKYKHQDSRIKKAQKIKDMTFANSDIKDNSLETKPRGGLLESFQEDAKYEHVGQDTRSQGDKDDQDKQGKYLQISKSKTKSKDIDKGSRSKITQHERTNLQHNKDQRFMNSTTKQSQEVQGSNIQDLTSGIQRPHIRGDDEDEDGKEDNDNVEEEKELDEYTKISDAIENEKMVNKTFKIYNVDHVVCGLTVVFIPKAKSDPVSDNAQGHTWGKTNACRFLVCRYYTSLVAGGTFGVFESNRSKNLPQQIGAIRGTLFLNCLEFRMTGPTPDPTTPKQSPSLQDQILNHISSLETLIKHHNEKAETLITPIRLTLGEEVESSKGKDKGKGSVKVDDDLKKPYKEMLKSPLTKRIIEFSAPSHRIPTNIRIYDGSTNPDDHISRFVGATNQGE
ncbi:hypothetical protein Tco_0080173 [Tanacetum coccineum]